MRKWRFPQNKLICISLRQTITSVFFPLDSDFRASKLFDVWRVYKWLSIDHMPKLFFSFWKPLKHDKIPKRLQTTFNTSYHSSFEVNLSQILVCDVCRKHFSVPTRASRSILWTIWYKNMIIRQCCTPGQKQVLAHCSLKNRTSRSWRM